MIVYFIMREEGSKGIDKIIFSFLWGVGVFFTKSILVSLISKMGWVGIILRKSILVTIPSSILVPAPSPSPVIKVVRLGLKKGHIMSCADT